jgi:penicillin-binding protein 1C
VRHILGVALRHKVKLALTFVILLLYWLWLPNKLFNSPYSTVLLDNNSQLLNAKIASDGQWRFPDENSVPKKFATCLLAFEDEYFHYHPGFNPASLAKSLYRNYTSGKIKSGGSTITMQVARMMRGNKERTYIQKFIEILLAIRIELSYKKESILRLYANHAPFGSNVVGLSAASWRYFGRSADKLSWAEYALLAVLPNAPSLIYPGKNQQKLLLKRNRLLEKLYTQGKLDEASFKLAIIEPLPGKPFPLPQQATHLMQRIIKEKGEGKIYSSSLHQSLQEKVNTLLNKHVERLSANGIYNAGALIAEVNSGKILAYVGNSYSNKNEHENFVDMLQAPRSTGSILKPFLYAFMLNENKLLPKSLLEDVPTQIGSYGPKNFHENYDGLVPADEALARSLNVPAVKMLQEYSTPLFHFRLKQLGFTTFQKPSKHYGLSLILGGGEARLFEIASAYASMGRALLNYNNTAKSYLKNAYVPLHYLNTSQSNAPEFVQDDLLKASAIWFTFQAMTELVRPQDYVGWARFQSKKRIAWKTGTSFGFRDAWAVGLNSQYVVAVWAGNADGEGRPDLTGSAAAAPLLFDIFNILPSAKWFSEPIADIIQLPVCKESGYKASDICPNSENAKAPFGAAKSAPCPFHKTIYLNAEETHRVNSECYPVSKIKARSWFVASPAQELFLQHNHMLYKNLPPYLPECQKRFKM